MFDIEHDFLIGTEGQHRMIQFLWRNDSPFYEALLTKTDFLVFTSVSHMDKRMAHWELVVFTYING
jgi:hypothetical protein